MNFFEKENFFPEPKKIKDTPEDLKYKLGRMMENIAAGVNQEFGENILNEDSSIDMRQWQRKFGGEYSKEDVKADEDMVRRKKLLFSGSSDMADGAEKEARVAAWEKRRSLGKPALLELATTAVFHKVLGSKFIVMKSSVFDDFENGADNIIVNKETGDVICAFDEVREYSSVSRKLREDEVDEKTRTENKEEKIKRKAKKGGARIKYGFGLEAGKLVKRQISGVPMFYLSVGEGDLDNLLEGMDYNSNKPNEVELKMFDKLTVSLSEQVEMLKREDLCFEVEKSLDNFKKSLGDISQLRKIFK